MASTAFDGSGNGSQSPRLSALAVAAATAWCRVQVRASTFAGSGGYRGLARVVDTAQWLSDGVFAESLTGAEKSRLTVRIYEATPAYRDVKSGLTAEEELVFARHLPPAPARILIGASGTGREALVLASRGYDVCALEPAADPADECRRRLAGRAAVLQLSYEELSRLVLDPGLAPKPSHASSGAEAAAPISDSAALPAQRFDAVLLGCGSLSHVLERREQRRLFQALARLCPSGPIIASFLWASQESDVGNGRPRPGVSARVGQRIGRAIGRLRGVSDDRSGRINYRTHRGFAYTFTRAEVDELAQLANRRVVWERRADGQSQYAAFVPSTASSAAPGSSAR